MTAEAPSQVTARRKDALLSIDDLNISFRSKGAKIPAVEGVSLSIGRGEVVGVVGESGSGKTVTALSIMRLLPEGADVGGRVILDGEDVLRMPHKRLRQIRGGRVAMIFQDPMSSLNPVLSVGRQLTQGLSLHLGLDARAAKVRAAEWLTRVGLPDAESQLSAYPHEFSGGMRQRIMIAMALSCNPALVIADEPTTALDVTIQSQILDLLGSLKRSTQTSLLLISHNLGVVAQLADRVYVMYAGRIVESSSTGELFEYPRMPYTAGLLKSMPRLRSGRPRRLPAIRGSLPQPSVRDAGCRFAPRCDYRRDLCALSEPVLHDEDGRVARCFGTEPTGWLTETSLLTSLPQVAAS